MCLGKCAFVCLFFVNSEIQIIPTFLLSRAANCALGSFYNGSVCIWVGEAWGEEEAEWGCDAVKPIVPS